MVVAVTGLPGTGKSYFASRLAEILQAEYINSDQVRKNMPGKRTYSSREKQLVYDVMLVQLEHAIEKGVNVVLDATFFKTSTREKFIHTTNRARTQIRFIEMQADDVLIRERLKKQRPNSEADYAVYKKVKEQWEPFPEPHLVLQSTNNNIEELLQKGIQYLDSQNDKGRNT